MIRLLLTTLTALTLASTAASAQGQGCPPRGPTIELLACFAERFGETPAHVGLNPAGQLVQILVNRETGTWTTVVSTPQGESGVVAVGTDWADIPNIPAPRHDRNTGFTPIHLWYGELRQPGTNWKCCGEDDCDPFPYRHNDSETGYELFIAGRWWPVNPEVVVGMFSPDGEAHACCFPSGCEAKASALPQGAELYFRCVVLPGQGV